METNFCYRKKPIGKLKDPHRCTYHLLYDCNSIIPLRMFQHHLSTLMFRGLDNFALHDDNENKRQEWSWTQLDAQKNPRYSVDLEYQSMIQNKILKILAIFKVCCFRGFI